MKLSKIDLSNLVAVSHCDGYLGLLIDRGEEMEYIEVPAPNAAYQGLQQVNSLVATDTAALPPIEQPAMQPINSSMAKAIGYDRTHQTLQVEFNNGSIYEYAGVEQQTWESLQTADSTGKFYNSQIKGKYQCDRVDDGIETTAIVVDDSDSCYEQDDCYIEDDEVRLDDARKSESL
jgi:hypothetical protein